MSGGRLSVRFGQVEAPWLDSMDKVNLRVSLLNQNFLIGVETSIEMSCPNLNLENRIHLLLQAGNIALGSATMTFEKMFSPELNAYYEDWIKFEVPGEVARFVVKEDIGNQCIQIHIQVNLIILTNELQDQEVQACDKLTVSQESSQALPEHNQPLPEHNQPLPEHNQPLPEHNQPLPEHNQALTVPEFKEPTGFPDDISEIQEEIANSSLKSEEPAEFTYEEALEIKPSEHLRQESNLQELEIQEVITEELDISDLSSKREPSKTPADIAKCQYFSKMRTIEQFLEADARAIDYLRAEIGPSFDKLIERGARAQRPKRMSPASKRPSAKSSPQRSLNTSMHLAAPQDLVLEVASKQEMTLEGLNSNTLSALIACLTGLSLKKAALTSQIENAHLGENMLNGQSEKTAAVNSSLKETEYQAFRQGELAQREMYKQSEEIISVQDALRNQRSKNAMLTSERDYFKKTLESIQTSLDNQDLDSLRLKEVELKQQLKETTQEHLNSEELLKQTQQELFTIANNNSTKFLVQDKYELQQKLYSEERKLEELHNENLKLQNYLMKIQAGTLIEKERKSKLDSLQSDWSSTTSKLKALKTSILQVRSYKDDIYAKSQTFINRLEYCLAGNHKSEIESKTAIELNAENALKLKHDIDSLEKYNKNLQDIYATKKAVKASYIAAKKRDAHNAHIGDISLNEMVYMADMCCSSAATQTTAHRIYKLLGLVMTEREDELGIVKNMLADLKKENPVYYPDELDHVDVALAEHLNGRDETIQIPFVKIRRGQYTFGTKKVILQVERHKLIVKVGAGFLGIEEFIQTYTDIELNKKPHKLMSPQNRKMLAKWAETIVAGEVSPPQQLRENLKEARKKYAVTYAVKKHKKNKSLK